ncbi:hypothetical protein SAMN05216588_12641 [Pseudomonas flavescens]|uniref:TRAM domain-containing protein n=1 Tax=Phytopseudomonas flavescens TaxID=29435 RepID=A0A1G8NWZ6_9GAMM|nr:hypothetical protein [Pseudomonas flavescens]SDI84516.1 hypothetical protein SAMN05216588_12641 [Pseudomonas flavescens]
MHTIHPGDRTSRPNVPAGIGGGVFIEGTDLQPGDTARVRIVDANEYDMGTERV